MFTVLVSYLGYHFIKKIIIISYFGDCLPKNENYVYLHLLTFMLFQTDFLLRNIKEDILRNECW